MFFKSERPSPASLILLFWLYIKVGAAPEPNGTY